jgi:hypothetical protein
MIRLDSPFRQTGNDIPSDSLILLNLKAIRRDKQGAGYE